ncbi:hypothetical protein GGR54DRAFT_625992 [Hypoxylon sp. NC1633]|nr:hypothetical protein GGR54DRAFT_625992 [Hypoxylon sp. NC1633]
MYGLPEVADTLGSRFCDASDLRSEDAWITFVQHPEKAEAQAPFRRFLHQYVNDSCRIQLILGPEKYKNKRMLDQVYSVIKIWRRLVASVKYCVLRLIKR